MRALALLFPAGILALAACNETGMPGMDGGRRSDAVSPPRADTGPLPDRTVPPDVPRPPVDEIGVWTQRSIPVELEADSGGVQTIVADPVRPNDFYAFVYRPGRATAVLKSTDFGGSWTDVNTTTEMHGIPWGAAIDPNPLRDPETPPTLYAPAGFESMGLWKSVDGGVTWENVLEGPGIFDVYNPFGGIGAVDVYSVAVLPDDPPNHIVFTYHYGWRDQPGGGFGESTDGGRTWVAHEPPNGIGESHYLMIVDSTTWLSISQFDDWRNGIWRTTTAGRIDGVVTPDAWEMVDTHEHLHGSFQHYTDPLNGNIFAPGRGGIKRSRDGGATWEWIYQQYPETGFDVSYVSNVVATERYLYADNLYGAELVRGPRSGDGPFEYYTREGDPLPSGGAGPFGVATSFDGEHWVIVMGATDEGIWRYVEP